MILSRPRGVVTNEHGTGAEVRVAAKLPVFGQARSALMTERSLGESEPDANA
jgi:hypothetical protein